MKKLFNLKGRNFSSKGLSKLKTIINKEIDITKNAGTYKTERIILGKQNPIIKVLNQDGEILNFCANNYLGLSSHPKVIEASREAIKSHGAGYSSVRFICGTTDLHIALEEKLAKFHNRDAAILYASCFDANAGIFEVLFKEEDAVISDELNHASIIDGIRLCKSKKFRYKNRDMDNLKKCLEEAKDCRMKVIVTDGVFSMDGIISPLKDIVKLSEEYGAIVFVDDCHATGFLGPTGRGTDEHFDLSNNDITIINSTLGKAIGGAMGGYTVGPQEVIDILRQRSRPYLFSNTLAPSLIAAASQALDLIWNDQEGLLKQIKTNTTKFRTEMKSLGFNIAGDDCHPICPIMLGDAKLAVQFADEMLKKNIYVIGFSFPVVPKGKARIRVQISAVHTPEQIDDAILAFKQVGQQLGVIN